jgi:hypothetical protein
MISEGACARIPDGPPLCGRRRDHEFAERGNIASQLGVAVSDHAAIAVDGLMKDV